MILIQSKDKIIIFIIKTIKHLIILIKILTLM